MGTSGILLLDKPSGVTSARAVRSVGHKAGGLKCGHIGTLDPMATGLLVVLVGNAVKLVSYYQAGAKRYVGELTFGAATDTDDAEGELVESCDVPADLGAKIAKALGGFTGTILQRPPRYSAVKVNGRRLHQRARRGEKVAAPEREVTIHRLSVLEASKNKVVLDVECGSGTYIRSLARDLGETLGSAAHLSSLRRLESAPFSVENAVQLDDILRGEVELQQCLLPVEQHLPPLDSLTLTSEEEEAVRHGRSITRQDDRSGPVLLLSPSGRLVAVGVAESGQEQIRVKRVIDT